MLFTMMFTWLYNDVKEMQKCSMKSWFGNGRADFSLTLGEHIYSTKQFSFTQYLFLIADFPTAQLDQIQLD